MEFWNPKNANPNPKEATKLKPEEIQTWSSSNKKQFYFCLSAKKFHVGKQGRSISFFSFQRFCWYVSRGAYLKLCWWCMWWWLIWKYALYVLFDKVTQTQMNDEEKVKMKVRFWWNVCLFNVQTWWYLNIQFTLA